MATIDLISFQLYSARDFPPLEAQLATLAEIGYGRVEPYGGLYDAADEFAEALARHGLTAPSGHFDLQLLEEDFPRALAIARKLGIGLVVAPYLAPPLRPGDAAGWRAFGERLAAIAEKCDAEQIAFGWHNHDFEVRPLSNGDYPLDLLLSSSPKIKWEADVGWIARAGAEPLLWLKKYRGRVGALHVKDLAPVGANAEEDGWADIGDGELDLSAIVAEGIAAGATILVAEHDHPSDYQRFARRSFDAAKRWA